jgi:hypothetical protein
MEGLENLNDELKKYIVINEYGLPNIEYPYYQFNIYYPIERHLDEINELFFRQKTYIDLLKEHDENIKFEVNENFHGEISIRHNEFIEINDIENYSINEIYDFFNSQKKNIEWINNIDDKIRNFITKDKNGIISFLHNTFELTDVLKYSPLEVNEKFISNSEKQKKWLENNEFEKYLLSIPDYNRLNIFQQHTINFYNLKELDKWELDNREYWELLRLIWIENNEPIIENGGELWRELFLCDREQKEFFMNEEERYYFNNLPNEFVVYRGFVNTKPTENMKTENLKFWRKNWVGDIGFSYSMSKEIGKKYFEKYKVYDKEKEFPYSTTKKESDLFEGLVKKEKVFGFINKKNEEEILIFNKYGKYLPEF